MLQKQVVDEKTFLILQKLQAIPELSKAFLVGGTSLALQIGHRISVDLDLFGDIDVSIPLEMLFMNDFRCVIKTGSNRFMQFFEIDGVKVDFVKHQYPWLNKPICEDGTKLASIEDIVAMKVNAIINRVSKKDFIDISFLLERYSLKELLELYQQKYNVPDFQIALRSLVYFNDADEDVMPRMIVKKNWQEVKEEISSQVRMFL